MSSCLYARETFNGESNIQIAFPEGCFKLVLKDYVGEKHIQVRSSKAPRNLTHYRFSPELHYCTGRALLLLLKERAKNMSKTRNHLQNNPQKINQMSSRVITH